MLISVNANPNMRRSRRKPYVPTPDEVAARAATAAYKKNYKVKPADAKHLAVLRDFDIDELLVADMSPAERKAAEQLVKSGLLVKRKSGNGYNTTVDGDIALEKVKNKLENDERNAEDDEEDAMDARQIARQRKSRTAQLRATAASKNVGVTRAAKTAKGKALQKSTESNPRAELLKKQLGAAMRTKEFAKQAAKIKKLLAQKETLQDKAWAAYVKAAAKGKK